MAKLRTKKGRGRYFEFLVDSGADYTLISQADAIVLGVEYKNLKGLEIKVEVANFTFIHAKKIKLHLTLGNTELEIPVLVAKEDVECLLGRKGVFEHFEIRFREKDEELIFQT